MRKRADTLTASTSRPPINKDRRQHSPTSSCGEDEHTTEIETGTALDGVLAAFGTFSITSEPQSAPQTQPQLPAQPPITRPRPQRTISGSRRGSTFTVASTTAVNRNASPSDTQSPASLSDSDTPPTVSPTPVLVSVATFVGASGTWAAGHNQAYSQPPSPGREGRHAAPNTSTSTSYSSVPRPAVGRHLRRTPTGEHGEPRYATTTDDNRGASTAAEDGDDEEEDALPGLARRLSWRGAASPGGVGVGRAERERPRGSVPKHARRMAPVESEAGCSDVADRADDEWEVNDLDSGYEEETGSSDGGSEGDEALSYDGDGDEQSVLRLVAFRE